MGLLGILGLPDSEDEDWKRRQQQAGNFAPETPTYMERLGRGYMDIGDQLRQAYYNVQVWNPSQADEFRRQRAEEERLYQKGFSYGHTYDGEPLPENLQGLYPDLWRLAGQVAAMTPIYATAVPSAAAVARMGAGGMANAEVMKQSELFPAMLEYMLKRSKQKK